MAAPRSLPFGDVDLSCQDLGTDGLEQSFGILSEQKSEARSGSELRPRAVDIEAVLRKFPDRWMAFLRSHFRNHMEVAVFFDITDRAARKWWEGDTTPRGAQLVRLEIVQPGVIQYFARAA